jgi:glycosyltransferase involved in cell wall biosynthesis
MKGIANSVGGRDYVEQAWSIPRKQLEAIYNGVDLAIFDPTSVQRHALRKEFNIPDDATDVSMIARISPEKGQGLLLDAAQHVLVNIPNTYFVIVGESTSDEYHRTLMSKLSNISGHDHILFVGFRNDVPNVLADTDVLVLPSSQEGLPNVALEALAMKTPVIASDVCATNEAVKDGVNGFLLKTPIDATELAAKLETLLSDNQLRTTMGERGRNLIEEQFNLENNIKEYEAAFTRLLNEERP